MFKQFLRGLSSFFTKDKIIILVVFLVLVLGLSMYSGSKRSRYDAMTSSTVMSAPPSGSYNNASSFDSPVDSPVDIVPSYVPPNAQAESFTDSSNTNVNNSSNLLPLDQNSQWATLNPVNAGNVAMPDLLQAGYHIGIDTIGQTLRNANYQYRSDPIIPKVYIGPWNQSTIEADYGRVPLEIGQSVA